MRYNHTATILYKGAPIISASNQAKTHPLIRKYGYEEHSHLHAELAAIIKLGKTNCRAFVLVVQRVKKNGELGLSKPCEHCEEVLRLLNFKHVYYSTDEQTFEKLW